MNEKIHRAFQIDLINSERVRWLVARWLNQNGRGVYLPPMKIAPRFEDRMLYGDHGDLFVGGNPQSLRRVEVKGLAQNFTGVADWPFDKFFVCRKDSWDRAMPKPVYFIYVSADLTHLGILPGETYPTWQTCETFASNSQRKETYYWCDPAIVNFRRFAVASAKDQIEALSRPEHRHIPPADLPPS